SSVISASGARASSLIRGVSVIFSRGATNCRSGLAEPRFFDLRVELDLFDGDLSLLWRIWRIRIDFERKLQPVHIPVIPQVVLDQHVAVFQVRGPLPLH